RDRRSRASTSAHSCCQDWRSRSGRRASGAASRTVTRPVNALLLGQVGRIVALAGAGQGGGAGGGVAVREAQVVRARWLGGEGGGEEPGRGHMALLVAQAQVGQGQLVPGVFRGALAFEDREELAVQFQEPIRCLEVLENARAQGVARREQLQ